MNNKKRRTIRRLIEQLSIASLDRDDIAEQLRDLLYDEEDVRDNYPESLQSTDAYAAMEEACDSIEEAISELESMDDDDEDYSNVIGILRGIGGV